MDLTLVIAPPDDMVDTDQRANLVSRYARDCVRIDLPETIPHGDLCRKVAEALA